MYADTILPLLFTMNMTPLSLSDYISDSIATFLFSLVQELVD